MLQISRFIIPHSCAYNKVLLSLEPTQLIRSLSAFKIMFNLLLHIEANLSWLNTLQSRSLAGLITMLLYSSAHIIMGNLCFLIHILLSVFFPLRVFYYLLNVLYTLSFLLLDGKACSLLGERERDLCCHDVMILYGHDDMISSFQVLFSSLKLAKLGHILCIQAVVF